MCGGQPQGQMGPGGPKVMHKARHLNQAEEREDVLGQVPMGH